MALTDSNGGGLSAADVAAVLGNNGCNGWGFGGCGSDWWVVLFLFAMMGGWGNGFGGYGGNQLGYDFPWLMNGQNSINANTNAGFDNAETQRAIGDLHNAVTSGFGDTALGIAGVNQNICQTGNNVVSAITGAQNSLAQQMYANQLADLERSFNAQTATTGGLTNISAQLAQCCCDNRAATQDIKYTIATEACANRANSTANTQMILDKLCQLELDGVKAQVAAEQRENANLRTELMYARGQASQIEQTAQLRQGQNQEVDALYNRLKNCPVGTTPVYGNQPIFTCPQTVNSCACGAF